MIRLGIGISLDRYAVVLFFAALLLKKARSFLLDWMPFFFILISYEYLRGITGQLNADVHFLPQLQADRIIFGNIPTISLQHLFFQPNFLQWYDYLATILYFLHFALPLSFAYLLWIYNRYYFKQFMTGISLLSYGAWLTYVVFPAAPPWLASEMGYLPHMTKIMTLTLTNFPEVLKLPTLYHHFNPNLVAAVPSLHAAYPALILLFGVYFFGKKALFFLPYVLATWLAIVYLGEHYFSDVIAGAVYALVFFLITVKLLHRTKES